jgi:nitrite reductase/ring-hydroxylating ferredoxin subunit/DMSO/TMAO reductase YedYZ heme-binding membrane subunit
MAVGYKAILWNRQKKRYDLVLLGGVLMYLISFIILSSVFNPEITEETLLIRSTGSLAITLLHLILLIGPLSRLDSRFLVLLYNRRHLGVVMFIIATVHAVFSTLQFHALGNLNPILSLFLSNQDYGSLSNFPFQTLGFFAWLILFFMAASSHDFWLHNLTPKVWKGLHMMVYVAYALLLMHVMLGVAQNNTPNILVLLLGLGMVTVVGLHLVTGLKERVSDTHRDGSDGFISVGSVNDIEEGRAKVVTVDGERVAVFKYDGKLSAISNVCQHQNGPLGEGRVIDGLITCPWHGYQYRPHDGCSPPPFNEKVSTYKLKLDGEQIYIKGAALDPGTPVEPLLIKE